MLGAIIGDIIGSRFEFNNHRSTNFELFHKDCSFTDDTICTVATAEALLHNYSFEEALVKWCSRYPNPTGGYGMSFRNWLFGDIHRQPYYSYGNGSAMRVSPVAWASDNVSEVIKMAKQSATATHNHPEGIKGAQAVADLIFQLRQGKTKDDSIYLTANSYNYTMRFNCDQLRKIISFDETCMTAVPYSFQCLKESTDFESAIRLAVSIGGDSDTIAAITGSLAEAAYGIPEWVVGKALAYLPDEMLEVINQFIIKYNYGTQLRNVQGI